MFDIGWYELLLIGVVALLVVGPKELPTLLRTVGRYVGMMRRQAAEFRDQFDQAMRESELDKVKQDLERSTEEATSVLRDVESSVDRDLDTARRDMDASLDSSRDAADATEIAAGASETGTEIPSTATPSRAADAAARAASRASSEAAAAGLNGAADTHGKVSAASESAAASTGKT